LREKGGATKKKVGSGVYQKGIINAGVKTDRKVVFRQAEDKKADGGKARRLVAGKLEILE